jgi:hypothetical protein
MAGLAVKDTRVAAVSREVCVAFPKSRLPLCQYKTDTFFYLSQGLIDYMAKSFSGGGALSGGLSGGVLGGGLRRNFEKATAEQAAPVELKIDVKVYKEDGNFVARAPLAVPSTVTLGGLKLAVSANTNGALPPNRQRLKYNGEYLPLDDHRLLREFVVAAKKKDEKIEMDLTIMHEA